MLTFLTLGTKWGKAEPGLMSLGIFSSLLKIIDERYLDE